MPRSTRPRLIRPHGISVPVADHVTRVLAGWTAGQRGTAEDLADVLRVTGLLHDPDVRGAYLADPSTHPYGRRTV